MNRARVLRALVILAILAALVLLCCMAAEYLVQVPLDTPAPNYPYRQEELSR